MAVKKLDVRGEICPDPLTLTMKEMEGLGPGNQLIVILDSPVALETISRWAQNAGHRVLEVQEAGPGQWEMTLEKR
ncbi:MAG: sulfurtransferase TusA family protein [Candidatus Binatia bacterium]